MIKPIEILRRYPNPRMIHHADVFSKDKDDDRKVYTEGEEYVPEKKPKE